MTNSVYRFTRMLLKLVSEHHPDGIAIAWDVGRHLPLAEYSDYKANRSSAPDQFRSQLPLIREVMDALGYSQLQAEGCEADDVIATVAEGPSNRVGCPGGHRRPGQLPARGDASRCSTPAGGYPTRFSPTPGTWRSMVRPDQYLDYAALRGTPPTTSPASPVWERRRLHG